jgi:small-conductance mechanosensitive channel
LDIDGNDIRDAIDTLLLGIRHTLRTELTSAWLPIQLGAILLTALVAIGIAALLRRKYDVAAATMGLPAYLRLFARTVADNLPQILFIILILAERAGVRASMLHSRTYLLHVAANLVIAWVVIGLLASLIRNHFVNRLVAVTAWTIAALSILRLLTPTADALDSVSVYLGGLKVTPLLAIKTSALLIVAIWLAVAASNFFERRIRNSSDLTPSIQVLIGKLIRIALISVAVVIAMGSMGIDLSVLAVFSGAVGVGVGFGLQKIVSNLVSGIILLADKSIKPGDVISVGDYFGWVGTMGARYTSVDTRDGREFLIPNEDFVTQRVVNWSYSNDLVRIEVPFHVNGSSNPHVVRRIAVETAAKTPRVLKEPEPLCHFTAFGETSLDFKLRFWICDPHGGITRLRSEVLLALWDALRREGIGIPSKAA